MFCVGSNLGSNPAVNRTLRSLAFYVLLVTQAASLRLRFVVRSAGYFYVNPHFPEALAR
jgi:hypothetical protein